MASSLLNQQLNCHRITAQTAQTRTLANTAIAVWHLASLDAPTVAVVWAFAIARVAHVHLELWIAALLATGTWTVYVLDRILDTRQARHAHTPEVLRDRHHFHWRHRRTLISLASCTGLAAIAMIVKRMPLAAREHDSIIAVAALTYFSGVHARARFPMWLRRLCSKEMLVGILFAAGCGAPTFARLHNQASLRPLLLSFTCLSLLAWLNCAAISTWESQALPSRFPAAARFFSITALALAAAMPPNFATTSALLLCGALSSLLLLGLHARRNSISPVVLRALADVVLLLPALLLIPGVLPA